MQLLSQPHGCVAADPIAIVLTETIMEVAKLKLAAAATAAAVQHTLQYQEAATPCTVPYPHLALSLHVPYPESQKVSSTTPPHAHLQYQVSGRTVDPFPCNQLQSTSSCLA